MTDTDLQLDLSTLDRDLADAERDRAAARLARRSPQGEALLLGMRQALAQGRRRSEAPSPCAESALASSGQPKRRSGAIGAEGAVRD